MSLSKGSTGGHDMAKTGNSTAPNLKGALSDMTSAKYNALLKLPPQKNNSSTFKAVPREYIFKKQEKEASKYPPVGVYRPKKTYTEGQVQGNVKYGDKSVWDNWGKK